jgi:hypothetical protein
MASSIRPWDERHSSLKPSRKMFNAMAMATTASSHSQPVNQTAAMPSTTPTEVHTSVIKCRPSASRAMER